MDFSYSPKVEALREKLKQFLDEHIVPRLGEYNEQVAVGNPYPDFMEDLKAKAKSEGLWNLFLPGLRDHEPGTRLTNMEYAPLAEIMGRITWASEIFNCSAPDTGNMELLHLFATDEQYQQFLKPLLNGEIRSAFSMTEPDVASSDATNIETSIVADGDEYVINGRKWWTSGALHPHCKFFIVMGKTDPNADVHHQQSMILVPKDTPGVEIVRDLTVFSHHAPEGHAEIVYNNVRVPKTYLLGEEGSGFALAQARLGPGRIHHCMRSIGACELALEMMIDRAQQRKTFGKPIAHHGTVNDWIARSRLEIEQARLLVLKTAWLIDKYGVKEARKEVAMIKITIPNLHTTVLDRAIQTFGGMGVSQDTPLAHHWAWGRTLRIADGPDEVHLRTLGRLEVKSRKEQFGESAAYLTTPKRD